MVFEQTINVRNTMVLKNDLDQIIVFLLYSRSLKFRLTFNLNYYKEIFPVPVGGIGCTGCSNYCE